MAVDPRAQKNFEIYSSPAVVEYYRNLSVLQPVEKFLFEKYVSKGGATLDLGVGGGRTTHFLSKHSSTYIGLELSLPLVAVCREKFPDLHFFHGDASDLSEFASGSIDTVVFSFNGIDYLTPLKKRDACFREVARVLKPGGIFIFSSHNSRNIAVWPDLSNASVIRKIWRLFRVPFVSAEKCWEKIAAGILFSGRGYFLDPVHGGTYTYSITPELLKAEASLAKFHYVEHFSSLYPRTAHPYFSPWNYFVFRKE